MTLHNPNIEAWRRHSAESAARHLDAVAEFERRQQGDAEAERRLTLVIALGCLLAAALITGMVIR